jgi:hypothetical protein
VSSLQQHSFLEKKGKVDLAAFDNSSYINRRFGGKTP